MKKHIIGGSCWQLSHIINILDSFSKSLINRHHFEAEECIAMLLCKIIKR